MSWVRTSSQMPPSRLFQYETATIWTCLIAGVRLLRSDEASVVLCDALQNSLRFVAEGGDRFEPVEPGFVLGDVPVGRHDRGGIDGADDHGPGVVEMKGVGAGHAGSGGP